MVSDFASGETRNITKEFQQKAIQFHGTFHGLEIKNWV